MARRSPIMGDIVDGLFEQWLSPLYSSGNLGETSGRNHAASKTL